MNRLRIWLFLGHSELYEGRDDREAALEHGRALGAAHGLDAPYADLRMAGQGERAATRAEGGELSHPRPIRCE